MTLKEAIKILIEDEFLGDFVYDIRERCLDDEFKGNSWDHPRVLRFNDAVNRLREELKTNKD